VICCPFDDPEDVLAFRPSEFYKIPDKKTVLGQINADYRTLNTRFPDCVNMTGSYISCFSGLIEMFGWDMLLMAAGIDPKGFGDVVKDYGKFILKYFEMLAESEADVVMIHDDLCWTSGAVMAPSWYREYVFPIIKKEASVLREAGKKILFRWIDHGLEIRSCSSIGGNKRGIRRYFFHLDTIDLSGNLIFTKDLLNSKWTEIEIKESEMKRMYERIRIDQIICANDLKLVERLLKFYD
jgi:hypothetical protein